MVCPAAALAVGVTSYTVGSLYPPPLVSMIYPAPAPPPLDLASPEAAQVTARIEQELQILPIVKSFREKGDEYYEARPYVGYPEERRVHSLTAGVLRGVGRFAVPPLVFSKMDDSESVMVLHVGRSLCGHDGIVHGGLLATLLDEALARVAILQFPARVGVTANLNIDYRAPTIADQFIVIRASLVEAKGRKATVQGRVEDLEGKLLVEAKALFVQPKFANIIAAPVPMSILGARSTEVIANPEAGDKKVPVPQEAAV
ncbi:hypothetical protein BOTBODRAFT_119118 [Botryobasidium botryosum FD-172 SS1]|uniref:Thioesterase domain-containing protein n=1 Tax=Botryobasidium botryosum (strain FD-172 SS1) TaxID=930990 RepID=A0A067M8C3_BOTB1|nr:hypothetical protein BOTBODRAFT_119118 [Botryobasidium botryosum FD-172 SS1]